MELAANKTELLMITDKLPGRAPMVRINGISIPESKNVKYLGVTIERKLTVTKHVENVTRQTRLVFDK